MIKERVNFPLFCFLCEQYLPCFYSVSTVESIFCTICLTLSLTNYSFLWNVAVPLPFLLPTFCTWLSVKSSAFKFSFTGDLLDAGSFSLFKAPSSFHFGTFYPDSLPASASWSFSSLLIAILSRLLYKGMPWPLPFTLFSLPLFMKNLNSNRIIYFLQKLFMALFCLLEDVGINDSAWLQSSTLNIVNLPLSSHYFSEYTCPGDCWLIAK